MDNEFKTADALPDEEPAASPSIQKPDLPPDGGYGWVCVACCFLINAHTWGINSSYGVFLAFYLDNDYYPGARPLDFAFVGGLSISMALFVSPIATSTTRLFGTRVTLLIGVCLETLALMGASFTHRIWQLLLSQGVCFGFGMGFLFVGSVGIVPQWFTKKRSLANGVGTAGSGIGGMMYSLATNAMIQSLGVGWAFRILAILAFVVNSVCAMLMKDRNKAIGSSQLAFDYRLFKRKEFLLLLGWGFFSMLGYIVLLFSLPNYALSIGLTASQGSVVAALLNLGQGLGRPFVGIFSDTVGRINIAFAATLICGILCFTIWIPAKVYGVLVFFAIVVGTVAGTFWTTIAPVGCEAISLEELPSALSIVWLVLVLPTTFSEPIALNLRQSSGNIYLHAQIFAGFMYVGAATSMWLLRAWKIGQIERVASEQEKLREEVEVLSAQGTAEFPSGSASVVTSSLARRLFAWKRV
ncbi:MAG: hypothetical protein HETSPECPRED_010110 [Heterodermia speciosa]|uniref:Major facilitator superfamily (MFS) profile domain-containing protein n=1 Tax=Heterodermia speciosa TaxID=116794 RepID=A0A8H3ES08_9LECA|nr:MAG: hypothetical protein HETSPECPRED_010110 [Heterodermia speciosa]